jgi:hypothetical protein
VDRVECVAEIPDGEQNRPRLPMTGSHRNVERADRLAKPTAERMEDSTERSSNLRVGRGDIKKTITQRGTLLRSIEPETWSLCSLRPRSGAEYHSPEQTDIGWREGKNDHVSMGESPSNPQSASTSRGSRRKRGLWAETRLERIMFRACHKPPKISKTRWPCNSSRQEHWPQDSLATRQLEI